MNKSLAAIIFSLFAAACTAPAVPEQALSGPYLGQPLPGETLELFAPGIVSDGFHNRDIAITPDGKEIYTTVSLGNNSYSKIVVHRLENGRWLDARTASFSSGFKYHDIEPVIASDGNKIFFVSNRPDPANGRDEENWDIWAADREGDSWGEPYNLGEPVSSSSDEYFPSVTRDGTMYFTRLQEDTGENFIFRCRLENGQYQEAEKLDENVNCGRGRFNAFVAPDESFIIVPAVGGKGSLGGVDYYIVFQGNDGDWSSPVNMGEKINSPTGQEWSASMSPDGELLFFMKSLRSPSFEELPVDVESIKRIALSPENGDSDVYWISSSILKELRRISFLPDEDAPVE